MSATTSSCLPLTGTWELDPSATTIAFSVRQFWGLSTVRGRFARFDGTLQLPAEGMGRVELTIEAASLQTGNRRRDRHLRSAAYFHCDRHRLVRFAGSAAADAGHLDVRGELQAAGRSTTLDLRVPVDALEHQPRLAAEAVIDARWLGMSWSPVGSLPTPVTLSVHVSLRAAR